MTIKYFICDLAISFFIYLLVFIISRILYPLQHSFSKDYNSIILSYKQLPTYLLQYERVDGSLYIGHMALIVLLPSILMAVASVIIQTLGHVQLLKTFYIIVPLFWIVRELTIQIDHSRIYFDRRLNMLEMIYSLITGLGTYLLILELLNKNLTIGISLSELRDAIWFAIIVYFGKLFWDFLQKAKESIDDKNANDYIPIIEKAYDRLKKKYGQIVETELDKYSFDNLKDKSNFKIIVYAVMIFEDYNRPPTIRLVEYLVIIIAPFKSRTLGIMQYRSNKLITNKQSIRLAIKKLYSSYYNSNECDPKEYAIRDYNVGDFYYSQVSDIYDSLLTIENSMNADSKL